MANPEKLGEIRRVVEELAALEYPRVWIGQEGMTPEEYLLLEELNEESPEWLRVDPGEFVGIESGEGGIQMPKIGYEYLDGLWVILNVPDELSGQARLELECEVSHIRAAKQDAVLTIRDSPERMNSDIPPDVWPVSLERLTDDDLPHVRLDEMKFYAEDTMGPYVVEDSERTRAALEQRLGSGQSDEDGG